MRYVVALVFLLSVSVACDREEYSNIPYAPVNYPLYDKDANDLSVQPSCLVLTTPRNEADRIGYGGLLVVHGPEGEYYAFDLCCPVEARRTAKLEVESSLVAAKCSQCGARFDISTASGFPIEGTKYRLTPYQVWTKPGVTGILPYLVSN